MKNWKQCTLMVFMALLVFTFIGCNDDPCICKNLHIVLTGEKCNKNGCISVEIPGQRVNGIPVTNRNNIASVEFDAMVTFITNNVVDHVSFSNTQKEYIAAQLKEIKIIPGDGSGVAIVLNRVLTVENNSSGGNIRSAIHTWLEGLEIAMMFKQMDNSEETVRLVFYKVFEQRII